MRFLLAFLRRRPRVLVRLAGWSGLEALPAVLSGQAVARAVDRGFLAGDPAAGLGWLGLLAAAVLLGAAGTRRTFRCLADLAEPLRDELVAHVVAGTLRRAASAGGGADRSAVARLTHQVEIVRDTFAGLIVTMRGFLFAVAGALLGLASLAPVVALLVAAPLLAGLAMFAATVPRAAARQRAYVRAGEDLAEHAGRAFAGLRDIAACGAGRRMAAEISVPVDAQAAAERAVARTTAARGISLAAGGWLPLAVVLTAAPWLVHHGLTAGAVLGSLTYLLHGVQPALTMLVGGLGGGGVRLAVTLDRILHGGDSAPAARGTSALAACGDSAPAACGASARGGPAARPGGADVLLRGVTFAYGRRAEPVVSGLDLDVRDGDHLAIIGPSGIGKSTLLSLLAGTLQPQQGDVRLGGVRTDRLDVRTLARHRVLIPQEAYVFTGTLLDNLRYLRPGAAVPDIDRAAEAIGLDAVVRRLGGYDARITPDALSAGERQLVALVRAYLSPARLVLLDEATCHLDAAGEARAERAFAARPGALVVVAHRVSSAWRASRILLLDGSSATLGTDGSLRRTSPLYRDLAGRWHSVEPAGLPGDADRLQPVAGAGLAQDR
ncbi:ATP-binding cassette domain-containing protein [Couchioplanes azureus]|uniref:ATP-binding cassette domain-containing protein n=1 Tax=Couchioplanes caeruleus TaxID=56438 RepID=UPI001670DC64|nr:ABC transporter ATP-binding protein [Couchioplanes caeruleus]GGQ48424.1 ABC transporter ATP-binding protein [Couchioplanes caeruleus subsp. azureus]